MERRIDFSIFVEYLFSREGFYRQINFGYFFVITFALSHVCLRLMDFIAHRGWLANSTAKSPSLELAHCLRRAGLELEVDKIR